MKSLKTGNGFTIFILFFGIAVIDSFRKQNWILGSLWLLMGLLFLLLDNTRKNNPY